MPAALLVSLMLASGPSTQSVDIGQASPGTLVYASEIIASPASPATLTNTAGLLDLLVPLGYNFSPNEVRHARIDCGNGLRFAPGSAVTYTGAGNASVGAINGVGSSVITFSITANDAGVRRTHRLSVSGDRLITGTEPVRCRYGLYDLPSQANAGGMSGRVAESAGDYIAFAPATLFSAAGRTSLADVTSQPPYTEFVANAPTTTTTAALAPVAYGLSSPAPLTPAGVPITLADLYAAGTRLRVVGDFAAAANADGSFTGAALARVYLSSSTTSCSFGTPSSSLSADVATFTVGANATSGLLCLAPTAGATLADADYRIDLDAVAGAPALYSIETLDPLPAGEIVRNGLELQAPLVQVPANYLSRLVLTNTGPQGRIFTITVLGETGNVVSTGFPRGTVPGYGTLVIDLDTFLTGFSTTPRAALSVTMQAPSDAVQGLYQIVNPDSGTVSNYVMVRPGTN